MTSGIAVEVPRSGEGDDPLDLDQVRRGDRHGPSEAIADQRDRFSNAAQQRQQQFLDMSRHGQLGALARLAPVEQQSRRPMRAMAP